ncbi:hypothetical protein D9757_008090 [Collybiopsis confluens]|uniref:Uncharacterized protein n=1 Tax=Collybiopsis confluens TaxID=2823264 RepID=A0A8H5H6R9_9AGAR|nr:hypothetical protein D9757_008090 [Collybiopsis confluens]
MSSPSSPTTPRRRLSSRRGSVSAPDPFAKHGGINQNPNRLSTSTLTIVKVVPNPNLSDVTHNAFVNASHGNTISLKDPPLPGARRAHRRIGSNEGARGRTDGGPGSSPRMSFAFSTFGPRTNQPDRTSGRTPSPSSTPPSPSRLRPASPGGSRSTTSGYAAPKPKLTPEQLYDIAHQATSTYAQPNSSPSIHRGSPRSSFALSSTSSTNTGSNPATFTPLHPSVYLPFVNRAEEVKALIESTPTRKLFALLKQTFPKDLGEAHLVTANPDISTPPPASSSGNLLPATTMSVPNDPTSWSYDHLILYLTFSLREDEPDAIWAMKVRKCVISHSELIWERVKGALGVPPELDMNFDFHMEMNADVFESSDSESDSERDMQTSGSLRTPKSDDMEDAGMKARGYWEGWDSVVESPVIERNSNPSSTVAMPPTASDPAKEAPTTLPDLRSGETTISSTPVKRLSRSPFKDDQQVAEGVQIPHAGQHGKSDSRSSLDSFSLGSSTPHSSLIAITSTIGPNPETGVLIEPILSQSQNSIASPGLNPPPLSLPTSLADASSLISTNTLGDIMEGAEEEEDEEKEGEKKTKDQVQAEKDDQAFTESAIDPARIHGLRISLPSYPMDSTSSNVTSPTFSYRPLSQMPHSQSQSLTSSLSRASSSSHTRGTDPNRWSWGSGASLYRSQSVGGGLTRTGSSSSIASIGSAGHTAQGYASDHSSSIGGGINSSGYDSEGGGYDPVGDRSPGNPLFPSNFASLATGPTLVANNPALRSPPIPPQSKYPRLVHWRKNKFKRSGSNTSGASGATSNDYAITAGSGSSIVGE